MAKTYCTITELEMDNIFKPDKWNKEYVGYSQEIVYTKSPMKKPNLQIKVYSSLKKNSGVSAGCGKDAIRVCCINTVTKKGVIKTKRINRVPGWEGRLVERVEEVWKEIMK